MHRHALARGSNAQPAITETEALVQSGFTEHALLPFYGAGSVTEQRAYSALRSKSKASRKPMCAVAETVLEMGQIA